MGRKGVSKVDFICLCNGSNAQFTRENEYFECPVCGKTYHTYRDHGIWIEELTRLKDSVYWNEIKMMKKRKR